MVSRPATVWKAGVEQHATLGGHPHSGPSKSFPISLLRQVGRDWHMRFIFPFRGRFDSTAVLGQLSSEGMLQKRFPLLITSIFAFFDRMSSTFIYFRSGQQELAVRLVCLLSIICVFQEPTSSFLTHHLDPFCR